MADRVAPIPDGFTAVTPHLVVDDAAAAIAFYTAAFGAEEVLRLPTPDGAHLMHAEVSIGGSRVMLVDTMPEHGSRSPQSLGGTPVTIHLYVDDVDAVFETAVAAGASVVMPPADMFWGDRYGRVTDPFGHSWSIATHIADPSQDEIVEAAAAAFPPPGT